MNSRGVASRIGIAISLCFTLIGYNAFPYGVLFNGEAYTGEVNLQVNVGPSGFEIYPSWYHFDTVSYANDPLTGVSMTDLTGNIFRTPPPSFTLVPDAGDPVGGMISVSFRFNAVETLNLTFDNFEETTFDYHRTFGTSVRDQSDYGAPAVAAANLPAGVSEVTLDLPVGIPLELGGVVGSDGDLHGAMGFGGEPTWVPVVIDPEKPGSASVWSSGILYPLSLEIIPEPTTFTLLGLGSLALVMVRRRR